MHTPEDETRIRAKYEALKGVLNERVRRIWAASEAKALGHGGIVCVANATGIGRRTIWAGLAEIEHPESCGR